MRDLEAPGTVDEALTVLSALARLDSAVREQIEHLVINCRAQRATWTEIGDALGITRQSAHARFSSSSSGADGSRAHTST